MESTNRAADLTALLGDAPEATDHEAVGKHIHRLADAGCSVLLIYPGSKLPADMRSPQCRNADDRAAQEAARAAGRRDWATTRSAAGLALATDDKSVLDGYLHKYVRQFSTWSVVNPDGTPGETVTYSKKAEDAGEIVMTGPVAVNLAIETAGSRLVVVDCDTSGQVLRWYEVNEIDADVMVDLGPTVLSPGQVGVGGDEGDPATWAHSGGGHFWFTVPDDVTLPTGPDHMGAMTWGGDDGFAVLWNRRYVLIPPSVRPEGPYTAAGRVYPLPEWVGHKIAEAELLRIQHRQRNTAQEPDGDRIDTWAATVAWAAILEPLGWVPAPRADSCGCEVWTAPGDHASPKSATAHEAGCTAGRYAVTTNAPLHIWTTGTIAPFDAAATVTEGGYRNVTKLRAVAATHYDNDLGAAMTDLSDAYDTLAVDAADVVLLDSWRKPGAVGVVAEGDDEDGTAPIGGGLFVDIAALLRGGGAPKALPSVLTRTDGKCLFYRGKTNMLFGDPETAKTWIALAAGAEVLCAGGRFVFIDMDHNGVDDTVDRLSMMGVALDVLADPDRFLYVEPEDAPHLGKVIGYLEQWKPDVALLDSVGELLPLMGANSNSNDEVTVAFNATAGALAKAGAAVVLIDHLAKSADSRRLGPVGAYGKTRIFNGAMVRVFRVEQFTPGQGGVSSLWVHKDRPGAVRRETAPPESGDDDGDAAEIRRDNLRRWGVFEMTSAPVHDADGVLVLDTEALSWTVRPPKGLHGSAGGADMPDPRKGGRPKGGKTVANTPEFIAEDSGVYRQLVEAQRDGKFDKKPRSIKSALQTIEAPDSPAPRSAARRWLDNGCPGSFGPREEEAC